MRLSVRYISICLWLVLAVPAGVWSETAELVPVEVDRLALVVPVDGLRVDGDFSDWPADVRRYPIGRFHDGDVAGPDDLEAYFSVAHDVGSGALYLAVEVRDESIVVDAASAALWDSQDGCEIYLAIGGDRTRVQQYALWGTRAPGDGQVEAAVSRQGDRHRYEWRLGPAVWGGDWVAGAVLAFDVAVNDRDSDGSFTAVRWGAPGSAVAGLGQAVLLSGETVASRLRGAVRWDSGEAFPRARVALEAVDRPLWRWEIAAGRDGRFDLELPQGEYRLRLLRPAVSATADLAGAPLTVELVAPHYQADQVPLGLGIATTAGSGVRVESSFGIQQGLWRTYGLPDGLASTIVDVIYQDRDGYLWFGTQGGVSRYDGTHFTSFSTADGLAYNGVSAIAQDAAGALWFGTWGGGVSRYDGGSFVTYTTADGLADDVVLDILPDREGGLWFATRRGVSRLADGMFSTFTADDGLAHDEVNAIAQDTAGALWFGTWGGGVSRYDGGSFVTYTAADGLAHDQVSAVAVDTAGILWFGTQGGVSRFDGERFVTYTRSEGLSHDAVSAIAQDALGVLWFATWEGGVNRFDGQGFKSFTGEDGLAHDEVSDIASDIDGNLWFATWGGGVSRYDGVNFAHFTVADGLPDNAVACLLQDRRGDVWSGGNAGLARLDADGWQIFTTQQGLAHEAVTALFEDSRGDLWIGTQGGLSRWDGRSFFNYTTADGLAHDWVSCIAEDADGALWFGTWGGGASRFDGDGFRTYTAAEGLGHDWINTMLQDRDGALWFGTKGGGLTRLEGGTFTTFTSDEGLAANWVWAISQDRDGRLWLGTDNGVSRYDGAGFVTLTSKDGLSSDRVNAILSDRGGKLWFGTDGGGVTRYDGAVFQNVLVRDGLTDNTVTDLLEDREGQVWLATRRGLTRMRQSAAPAPIHLLDVLADRRYGRIVEIAIASTQDYLAFEYQGVSLKTRPGALAYRYRLTGFDQDWRLTNLNHIEYHDLPLGDYVFEVGAVDRDLVASADLVRVWVRVHPPYGDIALYGVLLLFVAGLVWAAGQIVQRNRRLEVARRAAEEARGEADAANEAKSSFLANMSHEIRTPMNGIVGMVDMMRRTSLERNQRNYLSVIDSSADALLELINDILDLSKIEAGGMELESVDFDLWEVLGGVMQLMAMRAHEKGLELACRVAPEVPDRLVGDPTRLRQIIVNLTGNAIKFTAEGEIVVEVRLDDEDDGLDKDTLVLHFGVRDTGIGIPADKQELVFAAFSQADTSTTRQFGGTGLGLNISRQFVELMQGRIWLESEVGVGSVFQFTAGFGTAVSEATAPKELRGRRVLAAVANPTNRLILESMLESGGMEATVVPDGRAALDVLRLRAEKGEPFELALVDGHLPDMIGIELALRLHRQTGMEIMLLLTAMEDQDFIDQATTAGVRHHLRKPLVPAGLYDALVAVFDPEAASAAVGEREDIRLPPLAILLADDNQTNQYVATSMLQEGGHQVITADNGVEALERLGEASFDLVLMDVQMPEMDGYEATRSIRRDEEGSGRHLPIIGLTANAMKGDREACLEAGMDEYLTKPVRWEALRDAIVSLGVQGGSLPADYSPAESASDRSPIAALPPVWDETVKAVFDSAALENLRGMEERGAISVAKMAGMFIDGGDRILPVLHQCLAAEDGETLRREAHSLKGSAAYLGARELAASCQALEDKARDLDFDGGSDLIEAIEAAFAVARRAAEALVGDLPVVAAAEPEEDGGEAVWSAADIDATTAARLPQLATELEAAQALWEEFARTMNITEIEAKAGALEELGRDYGYPPLVSWAGQVQKDAREFDMEGIKNAIEGYADLARDLRGLS
jgi:signal transduction histidine kinase/ligand-binding sensor domain-containing protein/DNA-binding response OmpR family regulator/HPt (histidine-containing phosphotransfer) domain-containing protein